MGDIKIKNINGFDLHIGDNPLYLRQAQMIRVYEYGKVYGESYSNNYPYLCSDSIDEISGHMFLVKNETVFASSRYLTKQMREKLGHGFVDELFNVENYNEHDSCIEFGRACILTMLPNDGIHKAFIDAHHYVLEHERYDKFVVSLSISLKDRNKADSAVNWMLAHKVSDVITPKFPYHSNLNNKPEPIPMGKYFVSNGGHVLGEPSLDEKLGSVDFPVMVNIDHSVL